MLTVDYDLLGLHAGDRLLDIGCGFGRHSYEALRRGATVVASDYSLAELVDVDRTIAAMDAGGELPEGVAGGSCNADVTRLPYPDGAFDRVIASEVLEHVDDDDAALSELVRVLRPGGVLAATVPATLPEKVCWSISDEYHAPKAVGGHVRIYRRGELVERMEAAGLVITDQHRAHSLHSPYWWLRCLVGVTREVDEHRLTALYHRFLTWDIVRAPAFTRVLDRLLNPVLGKSLVVYGVRPVRKEGIGA